jgi:hypothetical protein
MLKESDVRPESLDGNTLPFVTGALAGIASVMLLFAADPAAAKPNAELTCSQKQQACSQRCAGRVPKDIDPKKGTEMFLNCITRTCNKQYDNCVKNTTTGTNAETPPEPRRPRGADNSVPMGGAKPDPKKPPKPRNDAPPTGGTKADPKPQKPRDDVRPTGGTKADPKPPSPGNSGPILLRRTDSGQPGLKANGSGASPRANGRK